MRKLINTGAAVHGWMNVKSDRVELFAYSKGYIGVMKNNLIYDEDGKKVASIDDVSLSDYIYQRNGVIDKDIIKRKLRHEPKILNFKAK